MSELLSKQAYVALAKDIELPNKAFINGQFVNAINGNSMVTENPAT